MLIYLLACSQNVVPESFLTEVTDVWWSVDSEQIDFYLHTVEENEGTIWINIIGDPHAEPWEYPGDSFAGYWSYDGNKFHISDDPYSYSLSVKYHSPDCYKLIYNSLKSETACLYNGPLE